MASWTIYGTTTSPTYWKARMVVTEQSQNIANNTTTLNVSFQLGRDIISSYIYAYYTNWTIDVGSDQSGTQSVTLEWEPATAGTWREIASRTVTVSHEADGSKSVNISCRWWNTGVTPSEANVSGSVTLTTIPRATTPTISSSITLGSAVTISLPRASNSFTHTLTYTFGGASGTIGSNLATSVSWTPPLTLASQIPNAVQGNGNITCTTYSSGRVIGTKSISFVASVPSSVVPTIDFVNISENVAAIASEFGVYVQGKSQLKVVTNGYGAYGSVIVAVNVVADGKTYGGASVVTDALTSSGTVTVTTTIRDSRGRTATNTQNISVVAYSPPVVELFTGVRADSSGDPSDSDEYLLYSAKYTISPINNQNTAVYQVQYKKGTDTNWSVLTQGTGYTLNVSDVLSASAVLDGDYPYNVRLMLLDYFGTVYSAVIDIPTAYTLINWHESGRGMAFGKISEAADLLEDDMPTQINRKLSVGGALSATGDDFQLTGNMSVNGHRVEAWVTTQTSSGTRYWIQFDDGTFILWAVGTVSVAQNAWTALGSGYYVNDLAIITMPFTPTRVDSISVVPGYTNSHVMVTSTTYDSTYHYIRCSLNSFSRPTISNGSFYVIVCGKA